MAQVQALSGAGDSHIHQAALFFQSFEIAHRVFMRKQTFFQTGDEHAIKFQTFGRMHRHQLHRVLSGLRLVVTGFQSRVTEKRRQR